MTDIFSAQHIHLTGIKGVAMTSIAQCLIDMGKTVTGSDVEEDFVTKEVLDKLKITIFPIGTTDNLQPSTDLLIYTSAHGGPNNPEVLWAKEQGIPTLSQAEALAMIFNAKEGIAVCGVGGKSTTSAMISWILEKLDVQPSFSVGVGKIMGMEQTGRWNGQSDVFVAEADEYVIDPKAEQPTPRFSFLQPRVIVCTNLKYDHPDVYPTFEATKSAYLNFFRNLKPNGTLIINGDDQELIQLAKQLTAERSDITLVTYGQNPNNQFVISHYSAAEGRSTTNITTNHESLQSRIPLGPPTTISLSLPGLFNHFNAVAAVIAALQVTDDITKVVKALSDFRSTQRRYEFIGEKHGVKYFDDYAHHPNEIQATVQATNDFFPQARKVFIFQPHTYSRTKQLFTEFVDAFSQATEVILLDIFASARESFDASVSSAQLAEAIHQKHPNISVMHLSSLDTAAEWCTKELQSGAVCVTLGAGDVYQIHDRIQ